MTTNATHSLARAIDNAIDHSLRLSLVSSDNPQEQVIPTGSGSYHAIKDVEDREFFVCSPSINGWDIEIYRAYLSTRISLLGTVADAIGNDDQRQEMIEYIERLQALNASLEQNQGRSFDEYLSPEQQEFVHLNEDAPIALHEVFQRFVKPYSDAIRYAKDVLSNSREQAKTKQSDKNKFFKICF